MFFTYSIWSWACCIILVDCLLRISLTSCKLCMLSSLFASSMSPPDIPENLLRWFCAAMRPEVLFSASFCEWALMLMRESFDSFVPLELPDLSCSEVKEVAEALCAEFVCSCPLKLKLQRLFWSFWKSRSCILDNFDCSSFGVVILFCLWLDLGFGPERELIAPWGPITIDSPSIG